jgi:hypothetical protein
MDRPFAWLLAVSTSLACAQAPKVETNFVPTVPLVRIDIEDGQNPSRTERDATLDLEGQRYLARIKIRGSSSAYYPKKQFTLKLRAGDVGLLGMARASSWVLGGPYADKTLIKNVLGLAQARQLFPYAPQTRWVELILNGDYHGVYALTEKIERGKSKVDVPSAEKGGFILKLDAGDPPTVESEQGTRYTLVYPEKEEETSAALTAWLSAFEASLSGASYTQYVDVESFIDFFLQEELWKNVDGFRKSLYLYRGADQKVHMGPPWDFDLAAAAMPFFDGMRPEGWLHARLDFAWPITDCVTWFNQLLQHPEYRERVVARWKELREPGALFSDARIRSMVDENVEILSRGPASRNFARWKVIDRPLFPVFFFTPLPMYETWEEEVARSEKFLLDRARWIDAHIEGIGQFEEGKLTY